MHYCGVASHRACLDCACDEHHRCGPRERDTPGGHGSASAC
jgi:hypothetical protein